MLTIDHLEKCFGSTVLFRDLTFTVDGPAVLWAPSGWGKTTLLRILMGLETPMAGRVQGAGRVSAVFQEDRLCPQLTAVQNALQASIALLRERVEGRPVLLATHDRAAIDALGWPVLELQKLAQPSAACNSTNKGLQ